MNMNAEAFISHVAVPIEEAIKARMQDEARLIVAIDGRCASGKTTLGRHLQQRLECVLFHMDDFFLRPEQRTPERLSVPGENVDHERFLDEVLLPFKLAHPFSYRPYDCHTQSFKPPITVKPTTIAIVEGAYACHPLLAPYYDLRVMLDVNADAQIQRILLRNGKKAAEVFQSRWIPLEEAYFKTLHTATVFDLYFNTSFENTKGTPS